MGDRELACNLIMDLGEEISAAAGGNKDAVARLGFLVENALENLEADAPAVSNLLRLNLGVLQAVFTDQVPDAQEAMDAFANALELAEKALSTPDGSADAPCTQAAAKLAELVPDELRAALEAAAEAPAAETAEAAPVPTPDLPAVETPSIESISARLLAASPEDKETLEALRDELTTLAGAHTGDLQNHLAAASEQLATAIAADPADAQSAVDEAGRHLEQASELLEQADELAEAETQADQPAAEEAPAEQAQPAPAEQAQPAPAEQPDKPATPTISAEEIEAQLFPEDDAPILPEETDVEMLGEFIVESLDHLTNAEGALLELESNPEDNEQINVVFRAFHTIKGTSGFLNLDRIQALAHKAENQLDRARDGEIRMAGGYSDLALQSCDLLRQMIEALQGIQPGQPLVVPENLNDLLRVLLDPEGNGVTDDAETSETPRVGDILVGQGKADRDKVEQAASMPGTKKIGQKLVESKAAKATDVAQAIRQQQQAGAAAKASDSTVRVSTDRLDNLINVTGELVIAQSMVAQDPDIQDACPRLSRSVSHAGKIIRELQDLTMSLRMVPLKGLFQKMARLVRDLGKKAGKQVRFVTEGEDTEIDRSMVEILNDPLVHMIRNSCDHGLETAEQRAQTTKDPIGTVTLAAYHSAGNVVIELRDDGRGINKERVLAKAVERGLVDPNKDLPDSEIFQMIFHPGFSTAEVVSDISGRGVGMDVVRKNIEKLRGRIDVDSKMGEGTTITIRLPLTMAITDGMLLRVGEERYLMPIVSIEQSFQPEAGSVSTVTGKGEMVMLRGELLRLVRLHKLYDIDGAVTDPYEALLIVIEGEGGRCALMVDELLGQNQVVIKSLGEAMGQVPGVAGGAILGDGRVGLILDASGILQLAKTYTEQSPDQVGEPALVG